MLRFAAAEIRALDPFDAALTRERFGDAHYKFRHPKTDEWVARIPVHAPELIVSQRFRQWCIQRKFAIEWTPVALE